MAKKYGRGFHYRRVGGRKDVTARETTDFREEDRSSAQ
jgi:hypothetical protein